MSLTTQNSIIASWVLLVAHTIDDYGLDSRDLFRRVGLDYDLLQEPGARCSYSAVCRLWVLADSMIGDPCLGPKVASHWHPTTMHALGYSWMASYNLDEAYQRTIRFGRFLNTAANGGVKIVETSDAYGLTVDTSVVSHPVPHVAIEAGIALFLNISRATYGPELRPVGVSLCRSQPDDVEQFVSYYGAPVRFGEAQHSFWLDPRQVTRPLATANPELVRINDQVIVDYLAELDRNDVVSRVRSKITERLPSGRLDEAEVAAALNLSQRSLQRRLAEQDMPYSRLLEETRRDLSREYVRDPRRSFGEIAYLLGFSEPANFSRAFKRWYGQTPTEFRQRESV